ncbi:SEY1 [[Candida] subhashii]|uniref:SEY1 n=1 Tax=[Candida] subhashii TaxID=561895 RepID=A0A8J5QFW9_9ASCO|nr:SEY1 [[Candida] subhashii]KAG7662202.1 SEY1 [[Candida] subhashii]
MSSLEGQSENDHLAVSHEHEEHEHEEHEHEEHEDEEHEKQKSLSHSSSSSSSFVPIDSTQDNAIQVVNESKQFNTGILDYITSAVPESIGNDYHIISVFGSQSTGKSTLLNQLFHTNFDVMNEELQRQQTTKGIWMAHSPAVTTSKGQHSSKSNIFVVDVEGADGMERGENQDFERKAALFAMATSEILIINIWETQIGLYQGANLVLLRTVFDVNLSLFGKSKLDKSNQENDHKVLLLIVIRDYLGKTPLEKLAASMVKGLVDMWDNLSKPNDMAHLKFEDFFDINFHALSHKVFQPEEFSKDVAKLGDRLIVDNELFKPEYHHQIPIDGWTLYAENCWEQIENNQDLDLPTQQIFVAQHRCEKILETVYDEFKLKFDEMFKSKNDDFEEVGKVMLDLRSDTVENYDQSASRYNKSIYQDLRTKLMEKLNDSFKAVFDSYAKKLIDTSLEKLDTNLANLKSTSFKANAEKLQTELSEEVLSKLRAISLDGDLSITEFESSFNEQVKALVSSAVIDRSIQSLAKGIKQHIPSEMANPDDKTWDRIFEKFNNLRVVSEVNLEEDKDVETFKFKAWVQFHDILHQLLSKEKLSELLKDRFDDKFRYDNNGIPILYTNEHELDIAFQKAKEHALTALPILSLAKLSDDSEILPEYDIFDAGLRLKYHKQRNYRPPEEEQCFAEIVTEQEKSEILNKFKKEVDAQFVETKRAIVQHITQIPYYIYLVILVLGWNEFMAIIRNPLFFSLVLILGGVVYMLYTMNLLNPAMVVAQRLVNEVVVMAKEKLKEVVDDHEFHARNLQKLQQEKTKEKTIDEDKDAIELNDL